MVYGSLKLLHFFYVRLVDSDANSYLHRDVGAVLSSIEHTKTHKYSQAAETINASFTPFVVTVDGHCMGLEAKTFIRHFTEKIAAIWHKSHSEVLGYVHARMAVLRATNLCIRGIRVKWRRRVEIEDGSGLPYLPE